MDRLHLRWTPPVLREEPAYRLLFGSQVLSVLGDGVTTVAMPFAVLAVGGGVTEVAVVSAAQFLPYVVLALPAGVWADAWDRKAILIWADLARMTTQGLAAALLLTGSVRVVHLVVLAALFGTADAFFSPAFTGLLPTTVSPRNLQAANALRGASFSLSHVAGPALAGTLIAFAGGPGAALALDAATFALSAALLVPLRTTTVEKTVDGEDPPTVAFAASLREGWSEVRSRPWVLGFLGGFGAYHAIVLPAIFVLGPVLMAEEYDGAASWALISTLFGVGSVLGDGLLLWWRPRRALRVAAIMLAGAGMQAIIIGSGLPVPAIGLLELLAGVCVTCAFTLWETSLGEHIPGRALSRVSSYDYLATTGTIPLGNVAVGFVAAAAGMQTSLAGMSALGVLAALGVFAIPSVRRLPRAA